MNDSKHTGETIAGVTVQMRFIPLKVDPEKEKKIKSKSTGSQANIYESYDYQKA